MFTWRSLPSAQRHQGENAALAFVIGAHDKHDVFERDDQDQRPNDQGQNAQDILDSQADAV